jgi:PAP2 superfamily protein
MINQAIDFPMISGHHSISIPHRPLARLRALRPGPELLFFAAAYLLYIGARWVFAGDPRTAIDHADSIIALEHSTHIAVEGSVQRAFSADTISWLLSNVYLAAQLVVLPGALIFLYHRARPTYRRLRTTVIATWMIAVPIHGLWPVAPPRLADIGIQDTVTDQLVSLSGHSTIFYNAFAAVPSLHVGFAFAVSIALAAALQARWAKALVLLWGPIVTLAVIATGNHFVFDAVAGLAVTLAGFTAASLLPRLTVRRRATARPVLATT